MPSIADTAYPKLKQNPTDKDLLTLYTPSNVCQISQILNQLIDEGYCFSTEAIAALSPYGTEHINRLGRYQLDLELKPPELLFDQTIVNLEQPNDTHLVDTTQRLAKAGQTDSKT